MFVLIAFFIFLCYMFETFKSKHFSFWKKQYVEFLPPSFPLGNIGRSVFGKIGIGDLIYEWHVKCSSKFMGLYFVTNPAVLIKDPELIKHVLVKDFNNFMDRGLYADEKKDPASGHLFRLCGSRWKTMRTTLTPAFSSGKLKIIFTSITDIANSLKSYLKSNVSGVTNLDIGDLSLRYSADVIGSSVFGLENNSFINKTNDFFLMAKDLFVSISYVRMAKVTFQMFFPRIFQYVHTASIKDQQNQFLYKMVKKVVDHREKNKIIRMDIMHLLMQLKNRGEISSDKDVGSLKMFDKEKNIKGGITLPEIVAQAFTFFFAGYETSATTINFLLYECALDHSIQNGIRNEITEVLKRHDGNMTYEAINEMTYLDRCISETLRKYPVLTFLNRIVTQDYTIPDTNVTLMKGMRVIISIKGLQHDPEYYPDPLKFDPDRFKPENLKERHPFTYLPFGEGPRNCIGKRMGKIMVAVGVATILNSYKVDVCNETPIPMEYNQLAIFTQSLKDIVLNLKSI